MAQLGNLIVTGRTNLISATTASDITADKFITRGGTDSKVVTGTGNLKDIVTTIGATPTDSLIPTAKAIKDTINSIVAASNAMVYKGSYNALGVTSTTTVNTSKFSTAPGTASLGWMWVVTGVGFFGNVAVEAGDMIISKVDNPSTTVTNYNVILTNLVNPLTQGNLSSAANGTTKRWVKLDSTNNTLYIDQNSDAATLGGTEKGGLFTVLENNINLLSITIGGVNKTLTIDYASVAGSANSVLWESISGKPTSFTPALHGHTKDEISDFAHDHYWANIKTSETANTNTAPTFGQVTVNGNIIANSGVDGDLRGNATTASRLQNTRNIAISGAATGNADFDGSGNINIVTSISLATIGAAATNGSANEDFFVKNLKIGNSAEGPNYLAFYGITGDRPGYYTSSWIGERKYFDNECTELILCKSNDRSSSTSATTAVATSGPDRIRYLAPAHRFETHASELTPTTDLSTANTSVSFEVCSARNNSITLAPFADNTYTLGTTSLKWQNVYATTFTGNLSGNATSATSANSALTAGSATSADYPTGFNSRNNTFTWGVLGASAGGYAKVTNWVPSFGDGIAFGVKDRKTSVQIDGWFYLGSGLSKVLDESNLNFTTSATNKNYKVQQDTSGNLYVNVPWEDTGDSKVKQQAVAPGGYTNWRTVPFGISNNGTEGFTPETLTDLLYTATNLSFLPSTGTLRTLNVKALNSVMIGSATLVNNTATGCLEIIT